MNETVFPLHRGPGVKADFYLGERKGPPVIDGPLPRLLRSPNLFVLSKCSCPGHNHCLYSDFFCLFLGRRSPID